MLERFTAAVAANRFGLGARPGELARIGLEPRDWLREQMLGAPPLLGGSELRSSEQILAAGLAIRRESRAAAAFFKVGQFYRPIYLEEASARARTAFTTDRPFLERLTCFWTNHFAVSVDKALVLGLAGSLEREAIRPHVLGRFADLLLAVERHPAMLLYLDNHLSVGPNSLVARAVARRASKRRVGINENLARETLELHTLGAGGGYTQSDVTTLAGVLTGWSIGADAGPLPRAEPGQFMFRPELHEPGEKQLLGRRYPEAGEEQGQAVLRDLAVHPATAHFIATKLARHFIADEPPAHAVHRIAAAFSSSGGDLPTVYRALIDSPEAWEQPLAKFKSPNDFIVSTHRGLGLPIGIGHSSLAAFDALGQRIFAPGSPAGWPDRGADWDGASAILKRIEWANALGQRAGAGHDVPALAPQLLGKTLTTATSAAIAHAASTSQALTLLLASPEFMRR